MSADSILKPIGGLARVIESMNMQEYATFIMAAAAETPTPEQKEIVDAIESMAKALDHTRI